MLDIGRHSAERLAEIDYRATIEAASTAPFPAGEAVPVDESVIANEMPLAAITVDWTALPFIALGVVVLTVGGRRHSTSWPVSGTAERLAGFFSGRRSNTTIRIR